MRHLVKPAALTTLIISSALSLASCSHTTTPTGSNSDHTVSLTTSTQFPVVSAAIGTPVYWDYTLKNDGSSPLSNISLYRLTSPFKLLPPSSSDSNPCTTSLAADASCNIAIEYLPTTTNLATSSLNINYTANNEAFSLSSHQFSGEALTNQLSLTVSPTQISTFINTTLPVTVTVKDTTQADQVFTIGEVSLLSTKNMTIAANNCKGTPLKYNDSCTIDLNYTPTAPEDKAHPSLVINYNDNGKTETPLKTTLSTTATIYSASLTPNFSGEIISTLNHKKTVTYTLNNNSGVTLTDLKTPLTTNNSAMTESSDCASTLAANKSCTISLNYTPTQTSDSATGKVQVTYAQTTDPVKSASFSAHVAYGQLSIVKVPTQYANKDDSVSFYLIVTANDDGTFPVTTTTTPIPSSDFDCGDATPCLKYANSGNTFPGTSSSYQGYPACPSQPSDNKLSYNNGSCVVKLTYTPANDKAITSSNTTSTHTLNFTYQNGDSQVTPLALPIKTTVEDTDLTIKQVSCTHGGHGSAPAGQNLDLMAQLNTTATCTWSLTNDSPAAIDLNNLSSQLKAPLSLVTSSSNGQPVTTCSTSLNPVDNTGNSCNIVVDYKPTSTTSHSSQTLEVAPGGAPIAMSYGLPAGTGITLSPNPLVMVASKSDNGAYSEQDVLVTPNSPDYYAPILSSSNEQHFIANTTNTLQYANGGQPGGAFPGTPKNTDHPACTAGSAIPQTGCYIALQFAPTQSAPASTNIDANLNYYPYGTSSTAKDANLTGNLDTGAALSLYHGSAINAHLNTPVELTYALKNPDNFEVTNIRIVSQNGSITTSTKPLTVQAVQSPSPCTIPSGASLCSLNSGTLNASKTCYICAKYDPTQPENTSRTLAIGYTAHVSPIKLSNHVTTLSTTTSVANGTLNSPTVVLPNPDENHKLFAPTVTYTTSALGSRQINLPLPETLSTSAPSILFVVPNQPRTVFVTFKPQSDTTYPLELNTSTLLAKNPGFNYAGGTFPGVKPDNGTDYGQDLTLCPAAKGGFSTIPAGGCSVALTYKATSFQYQNQASGKWEATSHTLTAQYKSGSDDKDSIDFTINTSTDAIYAATSYGLFALNPIYGNPIASLAYCNSYVGTNGTTVHSTTFTGLDCSKTYSFSINPSNGELWLAGYLTGYDNHVEGAKGYSLSTGNTTYTDNGYTSTPTSTTKWLSVYPYSPFSSIASISNSGDTYLLYGTCDADQPPTVMSVCRYADPTSYSHSDYSLYSNSFSTQTTVGNSTYTSTYQPYKTGALGAFTNRDTLTWYNPTSATGDVLTFNMNKSTMAKGILSFYHFSFNGKTYFYIGKGNSKDKYDAGVAVFGEDSSIAFNYNQLSEFASDGNYMLSVAGTAYYVFTAPAVSDVTNLYHDSYGLFLYAPTYDATAGTYNDMISANMFMTGTVSSGIPQYKVQVYRVWMQPNIQTGS